MLRTTATRISPNDLLTSPSKACVLESAAITDNLDVGNPSTRKSIAMSIVQAPVAHRTLNSRDMMRRVNALRATDNVTNWLYIAREYVCLGAVVGLTITFYNGHVSWGLESWLWDVPITLLAFVLVGA